MLMFNFCINILEAVQVAWRSSYFSWFLQADYHPPCLHSLFIIVSWSIWHFMDLDIADVVANFISKYCQWCTLKSSVPLFSGVFAFVLKAQVITDLAQIVYILILLFKFIYLFLHITSFFHECNNVPFHSRLEQVLRKRQLWQCNSRCRAETGGSHNSRVSGYLQLSAHNSSIR